MEDLRRRLAPIAVALRSFTRRFPKNAHLREVALCHGLASDIAPLLSVDAPTHDLAKADTAISIRSAIANRVCAAFHSEIF